MRKESFHLHILNTFYCIYCWNTLSFAWVSPYRPLLLICPWLCLSLYLALAASAKSISGQFLAISIVLCLLWHKSCFKTVALTSSRLWKIELSRIGWNIGLLSADELFPVNRGCFKKLLDSTYGKKPKYIWLRSTEEETSSSKYSSAVILIGLRYRKWQGWYTYSILYLVILNCLLAALATARAALAH